VDKDTSYCLRVFPVQVSIIIPPATYVYLSSEGGTVGLVEDAAVPTEIISPRYQKN